MGSLCISVITPALIQLQTQCGTEAWKITNGLREGLVTHNKTGSGVISVLGRWIHLCIRNVLFLSLTFAAVRVRHTTLSRRR